MVSASEKKDKAIAVIGTIVFHSLLMLLLIHMVFKTPIPPFPDSAAPGIEIDFGNLTEGTGNVEDDKMGTSEVSESKTTQTIQNASSETDEAVVTNDVEESVTIKKTKKIKKHENRIVKTQTKPVEEEKPSSALAEALAKFKSKKSGSTGGGDGNSGKAGNQGDPNGNPDGNGTGGTGDFGKGTSFNLKGRLLLKRPEITDDSQEEGRVVVEITVDESGKVIKADPGSRGSTTTNAILYAKARQAAFSAKFNASTQGAKEQRGTITFVFILD